MSNEVMCPAKIFLADERGFLENDTHRRYSTFNFGEFLAANKEPFGNLHTLNDEILPAGGSLSQTTTSSGIMLLIPVVGAIGLQCMGGTYEAEAGEVLAVPVTTDTAYTITNPFDGNWVNYLHIELRGRSVTAKVSRHSFDIEHFMNTLISVVNDVGVSYKLSIGRFAGREKFSYTVRHRSHVFAYVIYGAFELQERLMHERDGLALWDVSDIDGEALSNGAVLLLLELKDI